jgi:hypothetical protein
MLGIVTEVEAIEIADAGGKVSRFVEGRGLPRERKEAAEPEREQKKRDGDPMRATLDPCERVDSRGTASHHARFYSQGSVRYGRAYVRLPRRSARASSARRMMR